MEVKFRKILQGGLFFLACFMSSFYLSIHVLHFLVGNIRNRELISGSYDKNLLSQEQVTQRLDTRPELTQAEHEQRMRYAVIINAFPDRHFQEDVTEAYKTLRFLGFDDDNIFLLTSTYPRQDNGSSITTLATEANLSSVFGHLDGVVDQNDLVVIYTSGHGGRWDDQSTLEIEGTSLDESELKAMIQDINGGDYFIVADQCYSGGIANALSELEGSVMAFSSTDAYHFTAIDVQRGGFGRAFWQSFRNGEADQNSDGITTIFEAFDYACGVHKGNTVIFDGQEGFNDDCQSYISPNINLHQLLKTLE